jgi:Uma2 family endonuclease
MLVKPRADDYTTAHPTPDDVFLLIEVADSSLSIDREEKLPLYARAGIAEVWLINLPEKKVEVYREPHDVGYSSTTMLRPGDNATPLAFPDVAVSIAELLR